ncbi:putative Chaperone DnaJ-domain superfamily protein [Hibiscus syriacus]|uniref:Chaperone DnaJ-domain superfamily protein n=1 Tax=Hibiscus syriacus TaxID=106335 RepID=A0A6A2ZZ99_HIBSY|nr:putative Chaperone DnaJ-domain superfamily protein [Hibiscus syriacus]
MNNIRLLTSLELWLCTWLLLVFIDGGCSQLAYDWTVSYSPRAPLGIDKQVIVINDIFPGPVLYASTNDVVNVNIHNNLTDPFLMTWNVIQMRRNSWQDGVQETNCPILSGQNWTYSFQLKDQIGSFFYFPSLLHKAAGPNQARFEFDPGATYRLRISNVGLKTSLNFRIQEHPMLLVETEGSYFNNTMIAWTSMSENLTRYHSLSRFCRRPCWSSSLGPFQSDYNFSVDQARSMRRNLTSSAARPNPQDHYSSLSMLSYRDLFHIVFQNPVLEMQTWHIDGYNFFFVRMGWGLWDESKKVGYSMVDAVSLSTVYPLSWTAILVELDNLGTWNLRSQNVENWYLGQELYLRVKGASEDGHAPISPRDEAPIPQNVIKCGRVANL